MGRSFSNEVIWKGWGFIPGWPCYPTRFSLLSSGRGHLWWISLLIDCWVRRVYLHSVNYLPYDSNRLTNITLCDVSHQLYTREACRPAWASVPTGYKLQTAVTYTTRENNEKTNGSLNGIIWGHSFVQWLISLHSVYSYWCRTIGPSFTNTIINHQVLQLT